MKELFFFDSWGNKIVSIKINRETKKKFILDCSSKPGFRNRIREVLKDDVDVKGVVFSTPEKLRIFYMNDSKNKINKYKENISKLEKKINLLFYCEINMELPNTCPLTQDEVNNLDDGTKVIVLWSGGNGPHEYEIITPVSGGRKWDIKCVKNTVTGLPNIKGGLLDFVGLEKPFTMVWLAV